MEDIKRYIRLSRPFDLRIDTSFQMGVVSIRLYDPETFNKNEKRILTLDIMEVDPIPRAIMLAKKELVDERIKGLSERLSIPFEDAKDVYDKYYKDKIWI